MLSLAHFQSRERRDGIILLKCPLTGEELSTMDCTGERLEKMIMLL